MAASVAVTPPAKNTGTASSTTAPGQSARVGAGKHIASGHLSDKEPKQPEVRQASTNLATAASMTGTAYGGSVAAGNAIHCTSGALR